MEGMSGKLFFFSLPVMLAYNHFLQNHRAYTHCPGPGEREMNEKVKKVQSVPEIPSKQRPCMYLSRRGSLCTDSQQAKKAVYTWVRTPTLGKSFLFSDSISSMAKWQLLRECLFHTSCLWESFEVHQESLLSRSSGCAKEPRIAAIKPFLKEAKTVTERWNKPDRSQAPQS